MATPRPTSAIRNWTMTETSVTYVSSQTSVNVLRIAVTAMASGIAAEVGHLELAYDYLSEAALIDLDDIQHNTRDGLHIASLAGTWIAAVAGLGGMRDHDGVLSFSPRLPQALTRIAFRLCFSGRRLLVEVGRAQV